MTFYCRDSGHMDYICTHHISHMSVEHLFSEKLNKRILWKESLKSDG